MRHLVNSFKAYPALSLASAMVWGMVEFVALQRAVRERASPQG